MHKLLVAGSAVVALAGAPALAAQSFEGVVGLRTPNGPVEAMVKNGKARLNTQSPMGAASIIIHPATNEMYIVVEAQRMVMVMKGDDTQPADSATQATDSVTALGQKATVAEHECEIYRVRSANSVRDVCIASGLGDLGISSLFSGMGSSLGRMMGGGGSGAGSTAWTRTLAKKRGFPLRVADTTGAVQYEVTRVEPKKLDDALFIPPADFQRMQMPSFGRPPGNR